jgi:hypothetical protein
MLENEKVIRKSDGGVLLQELRPPTPQKEKKSKIRGECWKTDSHVHR